MVPTMKLARTAMSFSITQGSFLRRGCLGRPPGAPPETGAAALLLQAHCYS
jgi:hypothetical protein